ncbi:MAG TPA: apolipoprotein N-acyltransferase [Candidatus Binatus sp.]|uniref:apolipoprotein N-acyltransferase n=1 Tax=Candidatus Binatus sp. TaxID=2811406 RepID=UPI002F41FB2A
MSSNNATRAALAVASGLAMGLAFPKFDHGLLAWIALVPLFYLIEGESLRRVFWWAYLQGFASYVVQLYWIPIPLHDFADVHMRYAIFPMLALAGIVAFNTAVAIWAGEFVARRTRIPAVLTMPVAWTAVEWIRTWFPVGFPWNLLGYTAYHNLELIQFAEFTGVYGVSALIVFFNAVVYVVIFRRGGHRLQAVSLSALTAMMLALVAFGAWRINNLKNAPSVGKFKVAMVQGNIPQSLKWDPKFLPQSYGIYQEETADAAKRGADLIVWPEAAAVFLFQPDDQYPAELASDAEYRTALLTLAKTQRAPILFGAPALARADGRLGFYNRAYLVSANGQGEVDAHYDKIELVPFGEYVPARAILGFFVNRIVEGFGDLIPGKDQTLFDLKGAKLGILICYESIFPDLTRREVDKGADVLVNITNDAWYGESSAPYQVLAMAALRSVETKVPMVRVANTGFSALIEPSGRITYRTPLFKRDNEIVDVSWRPVRTLYTMVGDLFAEICFVLTLIGLIMAWRWPQTATLEVEPVKSRRVPANGRPH